MPSITPVARAVIGATAENTFQQPRTQLKASTGMDLPSLKALSPASLETKSEAGGQPDITEDTGSKEVTLSPQLTALARKQQKLQQEIQAQRDKEAQFAAKEKDYVSKSTFKEKLQANALETLQELGIDYEELTNLILTQSQSDDPVKKLEAKIQKLETDQEQSVSKQYEATIGQYKKEIEKLISTDESYVTIKEENAQDAVLQHILDTFKDDGTVMSVEEASKDIEEFLVDEAIKKTSLTKVKAKLAPPAESTEKKLPPPKTAPKTLTQQVESTPTRTYGQFQHLSMKERVQQAIARAQK